MSESQNPPLMNGLTHTNKKENQYGISSAFIHRFTRTGEIHEQQCYRSGHNGRNRGDSEDLRVDILHDFCGLCPNIGCGKGRLAEHQ